MQSNDSKELSEETKKEYIKQGDALLYKIEFYLERVSHAEKDLENLKELYIKVQNSSNPTNKAVFSEEFQEQYKQYLITLKIAKEAHELLAKEEREIIFSLHPKLSEARKLFSEVMSDIPSPTHQLNPKDEEKLIEVSGPVLRTKKIPDEVLSLLGMTDLAYLQLSSKKFKQFTDQLLTDPNTVIKVGTEVHAVNTLDFLEFYMQSEAYKNLREKFETDPTSLRPAEYVCIALTTHNIYELSSIALKSAIEKLPLDLRFRNLAKNLALVSDLIQLHEQPLLEKDEKFIQGFIKNFNTRLGGNEIYMNLQGAKVLPGLNILGGANVKNASLPIRDSLKFISKEALKNPNLLVGQLDQLQKMLGNNNTNNEELRKWRLMILDNCFSYAISIASYNPNIFASAKDGKYPNDSKSLENIIKSIDIALNHPFTKEKSADYEFDLKGSVFRLLNSGPDTRTIHKKLKDLKKDLEKELNRRSEKKDSKRVEPGFGKRS